MEPLRPTIGRAVPFGAPSRQNETFTTGGEGGVVTTDDEDLAWEARSFRDHGYDVRERMNLLALEQKPVTILRIVEQALKSGKTKAILPV